jgi:hypothetical protein
MLSYILQTLSSDRTFGPALNEHLRINIPTKWVVSGNASDFLIVVSMIPLNQVVAGANLLYAYSQYSRLRPHRV